MLSPVSGFAQCQSCVNAVTVPSTPVSFSTVSFTEPTTQAASTGLGLFSITLSGVPAGNSLANQTYSAWCATWFGAALQNNPGAFPVFSPTTIPTGFLPLGGKNTFNMVNYILNNKQGTIEDVQDAIWTIMTGNTGSDIPSTAALAMVAAALLNPNFVPNAGGVVGVYYAVDPGPLATTVAAGNNVFQNLFLEVPVPASTTQQCSSCVNAITLPSVATYTGGTFNDTTQAASTGAGFFSLTLSGVLPGFSIGNQTYSAWCAGWFGAAFTNAPATFPIYSTYGANFPSGDNPIVTGDTFNMVNYILNNKSGTVGDVQDAIWTIITGNAGHTISAAAQAMVTAAKANPTYCPPTGGKIAMFLATNLTLPTTAAVGNNQFQNLLFEVTCNGTTNQGTPSLSLKKTAGAATVNPFQKVTYTYVVTNTGTVALTNITVVDDNGTPGYTKDDFTVGTIASLGIGASATLTATVYPPVQEASNYDEGWGLNWGWNNNNSTWDFDYNNALPGGTVICKDAGNGKLQFTYKEDTHHTDNTYGNNSSWDWGWWGHQFSSLAGSEAAEFQILDKNGNNCLDFVVDYVSQNSQCKSGWGTKGVSGGNGYVIKGDGSKVLNCDTSISHNINSQAKYFQSTQNSPSQNVKDWDFNQAYTVTVDTSVCGTTGFGGVKCPIAKNNPAKWYGCNNRVMRPTSGSVTNTATASVTVNGTTISATAKATVVCVDLVERKPVPVPDSFRERIASFEAAAGS